MSRMGSSQAGRRARRQFTEEFRTGAVRLVFDEQMIVRDVFTFMEATPWPACLGGGLALRTLIGLRIGGGWTREVKTRLGGAASCTHLMELLIPMATAAIQSMSPIRNAGPDRLDASGSRGDGGCH